MAKQMVKKKTTKKPRIPKDPLKRRIGDQKFSIQFAIDAIYKKGGYVTAVAEALNVNLSTVWRWSQKYPEIAEAFEMAVEKSLDFTESKLMENIKKGDVASIIFNLKTKGKHRGYVERQEQQQIGKVIHEVVWDDMPKPKE